jgi:TIR domain-containing protein
MPDIFISYRREDSAGHAGRLFDCVRERFGDDAVFLDVTDLRPGVDFTKALDGALASSRVVLVVIGTQWLTAADATGRRRLDDPGDFVRIEIAHALERDAQVIPVLVRGAKMPREEDLPEDLRPLARRQAQEISDTRWAFDTEELLRTIGGARERRPQSWVRVLAPAAALIVVLGVMGVRRWGVGGSTSPPPSDRGSGAGGSKIDTREPPEARLPASGEARAGAAVFKVLGGLVSREASGPHGLRLYVRTTNVDARYGLGISGDSFRLIVDGRTMAPADAPIEVVSMRSAKDGWVTFQVPEHATAVQLQVGDVQHETAKIPIDLRAAAPIADVKPPSWRYPVDLPVTVEQRIDSLTFIVRGARLEHLADAVPPLQPEKLELSLKVRIRNVGAQYGYSVGSDEFRLLADGVPLAPVKFPIVVVNYHADVDGDVAFVMPGTTTQAVLQFGNVNAETARVPVDLSTAR